MFSPGTPLHLCDQMLLYYIHVKRVSPRELASVFKVMVVMRNKRANMMETESRTKRWGVVRIRIRICDPEWIQCKKMNWFELIVLHPTRKGLHGQD
jgi:hypothetical protein